jgi:hypothetical protein
MDCCSNFSRVVLELLDQKGQDFLVSIALKRLFSEYVRKVFIEITMRT